MLQEKIIDKLNQQITLEFFSSNFYLQMSAWCTFTGLENCALFLREHSQEELTHMFKIFDYLNDSGARVVLGRIDQPPHEYKDVRHLFQAAYDHEVLVTSKINELAALSFADNDFATFNFMQWYVAEQHEEEKLFKTILDKVDIIGMDGRGLYHIDLELGKIAEAKDNGLAAEEPQ